MVWYHSEGKEQDFKGSKRGEAPLTKNFPLSFEGEGDKGGEVD